MYKLLGLIFLFTPLAVYGQQVIDTTFSVRGFTCQCKYLSSGKPDVKPFDLNEKPPYYPGGADEFKKFLRKNIDKSMKWKEKVNVTFKVDKNGDLYGFQSVNYAAVQKFQEVVRVLKLSGKWFPAVREGYCVEGEVTVTAEL